MKQKLFSILALLLMVAAGAWADESSESFTTTSGATSYTGEHFKISLDKGGDADGFILKESAYATIEALNGEIITKVEFTCGLNSIADLRSAVGTITLDGVVAATVSGVNATSLAVNAVDELQIKAVKVYYGDAAPATYSITLDEGTGNKDSQNWEITPKSSELSGSEAVTVKYNGSREVKSVTVVKKAEKAVDNTYLEWSRRQKKLVATEIPTTYKTVENSNEDVTWDGDTYVVEGQVTVSGQITLESSVNLIIKDGAKLTANKIIGNSNKLYIYGQAQMTGELVVNCSDNNAISNLSTLEVHSAKVTATSSANNCGGFNSISTFNVYGGLVDAKNTGSQGFGICLNGGGSMNIYGGEVKAEGKGVTNWGCGILCNDYINIANVTVYGGKLWNSNLFSCVNLQKGDGFTGKIETSNDGSFWDEYNEVDGTLDTKYVRVGY